MNKLLYSIIKPGSPERVQQALCFLRIGIGVLTFLHGVPKIMGGVATWQQLGTFMYPLGIYFLPVMWGFLGACAEFFGGISLVFGLGTRFSSLCLTFMMFVATVWHIHKGDPFNVYSFPLSLIVVYLAFVISGSDKYSLDYYFSKQK